MPIEEPAQQAAQPAKAPVKKPQQFRITWKFNRTTELYVGGRLIHRFAPYGSYIATGRGVIDHPDFKRIARNFVVQEVK